MTTQIPTNNLLPDAVPSGILDETTIAQLANQFFQLLPGQSLPIAAPAPVFNDPISGKPIKELQLAGSAPVLTAVSNSTPIVTGIEGLTRPVTDSSGLDTYAIDTPVVTSTLAELADPLGAAFYFLPEVKPAIEAAGVQAQAEHPALSPWLLPGEGEIRQVLQQLYSPVTAHKTPATAIPSPTTGHFYFVDSERLGKIALSAQPAFDVTSIRRDFPILQEKVNGRPLVWFDNAATTQKPQSVIDRLAYFYAHENSNIHRAAHTLAGRATDAYESARQKVARFIGAGSTEEIIFVRGATEGINLLAKSWGMQNIGAGDEIVVSLLEHHANIVPWQQLAALTGAKIRVIPVDDSGQIRLDEYQKLLNERTKLVAITQVSNALGTVTPVKQIVELAHRVGAKVLVDGAQSVAHLRVNVQALDADFFVFSGHKIFGPTGIGVVYGKKHLLDAMPPWQGGGNMIADVTFERTLFQPAPNRFEAGTGNIADAVGLGAALDYVDQVGLEAIARYEHELVVYATQGLSSIPGVRLVGTAVDKASVVSFVLDSYKPDEVGKALNAEGIAVRSGHHCAQPILRRFGLEATVRPSMAFYNTFAEVDLLVTVINRLARYHH